MAVSTPCIPTAAYRCVPPCYSSLAAATYLTWSAMIWTALLTEEQHPATASVHYQMVGGQLHVGEYNVGNELDVNLYGHPEIRY